MTEFEKNCTLLVNSCDSYADCWDGYFQLLKIQWPSFDMDIVLNTERKSYTFDGLRISTFQFYKNKKAPQWGKRLIETLKNIQTKYVLFALDDFYYIEPIKSEVIEQCYQWMEEDNTIAYFSFLPTEDKNNIVSEKYKGFEQRPQKGAYRLNCQMALWNREKLISYIRCHESPWEWELYGSIRSSRYKEKMFTISNDSQLAFPYLNGGVIARGRWYYKRVVPLIEKYNLKIDLSKRGRYEDYCKNEKKEKRILLRGIKNRIHKILSLI